MRNWFNRLRDTVDDVVHDVTDPFIRCASTNNGLRCVHDKNHSGSHEDSEGNTW